MDAWSQQINAFNVLKENKFKHSQTINQKWEEIKRFKFMSHVFFLKSANECTSAKQESKHEEKDTESGKQWISPPENWEGSLRWRIYLKNQLSRLEQQETTFWKQCFKGGREKGDSM